MIAVDAYLRRRTVTSWTTAAWGRADIKLPDLADLLGETSGQPQKQPQSAEQLEHAARVWNVLLAQRSEE